MASSGTLTIAHILQWFELGGGESVALHLAGRQVEQGHDVHVAALSAGEGPLAREFRERGVSVHNVEHLRQGFDPLMYGRMLGFFSFTLRPDVVHTHDPHSLVYAAAPGKLRGATVVHTKHGADATPGFGLWLMRGAGLFVDTLAAVSQETAQTALKMREISESKLRVIENGIDLDGFAPDAAVRAAVREELGIPADAWVVGAVGRVEAVKNHALLLRALAPLLDPKTHLVLVGDGSLRGELEKQVASIGEHARSAHLLGMRRDVARLSKAFDAFAISSDSEGLPLALLEAMAGALPVASTAVGGIAKVIEDGKSGLLCPAGDETALRAQLQRLRDDAELSKRLGAGARQVVEARYSLDATLEQYMQLYRR
ncbi:MAG: glycosyltransferase [Myxococcales bacterium]|nr:glycosyltransferase [Myxococcales bacterium]